MPASIGVNLRVTGHCRQGGRKYMEDFFSVAYQQTEDEKDLEYAFFGIYDGHGGGEAATFAKEHLMESIVRQKNFWSDKDEDVLKAIKEGYIATHYAMWKEQDKWPKTASGLPSTAGTTASVAFIRKGKIYIGHVGDSGIILGYQDPGSKGWLARPLTKDHKPENEHEMSRIEQCGGKVVTKSGVPRVVWNRPRLGHKGPVRRSTPFDEIPFLAVARSLGDLWSYNSELNEFVVSPDPDTSVVSIDSESFRCLIFGTDGLWNMISPATAVSIVQMAEQHNERNILTGANKSKTWLNPSKCLVERALERWSSTKMRADNTSVVTLMLDPPGPPRCDVVRNQRQTETATEEINKEKPSPYPENGLEIMTVYREELKTDFEQESNTPRNSIETFTSQSNHIVSQNGSLLSMPFTETIELNNGQFHPKPLQTQFTSKSTQISTRKSEISPNLSTVPQLLLSQAELDAFDSDLNETNNVLVSLPEYKPPNTESFLSGQSVMPKYSMSQALISSQLTSNRPILHSSQSSNIKPLSKRKGPSCILPLNPSPNWDEWMKGLDLSNQNNRLECLEASTSVDKDGSNQKYTEEYLDKVHRQVMDFIQEKYTYQLDINDENNAPVPTSQPETIQIHEISSSSDETDVPRRKSCTVCTKPHTSIRKSPRKSTGNYKFMKPTRSVSECSGRSTRSGKILTPKTNKREREKTNCDFPDNMRRNSAGGRLALITEPPQKIRCSRSLGAFPKESFQKETSTPRNHHGKDKNILKNQGRLAKVPPVFARPKTRSISLSHSQMQTRSKTKRVGK